MVLPQTGPEAVPNPQSPCLLELGLTRDKEYKDNAKSARREGDPVEMEKASNPCTESNSEVSWLG
jgi:hypothetical protein